MKLKITYDNDKDKFYFDYDDGTLETFYGFYAAIEALSKIISQRTLCYANPRTLAQDYINTVFNDSLLEIEV